jgi:hypothetical protein
MGAGLRRAVSVDVVVGMAMALPILLVRSPPMVDFCGHEAVVGVLAHWGSPSHLAGHLYRLNLGHPNQLQYLVAWPVALLFGAAKGLEVSVALGAGAVVAGAGHLAAYLRRPRWVALFAVPVAVGWYFQWGMIANMLGAGALFFALPALDRYVHAPEIRRLPAVLAWLLLLYVAHEVALVIACVAIACAAGADAVRSFSWRRAAYSIAPCVFALALVLVQLRLQRLTPTNRQFFIVDAPFLERLLAIPSVVVGHQDQRAIEAVAFALCALPLLSSRLVPARALPAATATRTEDAPVRSMPYVVLAALLFVAYCFLPHTYNGVLYFSHRFLPIAWVLAIVVAFRPDTAHPRAYRLVAYSVPCMMAALAFPAFMASDACYRELDSLLGAIEPGSAVASIELDRVRRGAVNLQGYSTRMAHGHIVADRGGRSLFDYTQSPISPALMLSRRRWDRMNAATFLDPTWIRPRAALSHFRYLAIHSTSREVQIATARVLDGVASVAGSSASWVIFESREELVPADAPEGSYPEPVGDTLREELASQSIFSIGAPQ